jgi:hypothetical protein
VRESSDIAVFAGSIVVFQKIDGIASDNGYRAEWIDVNLLELGIAPVIPLKENHDRDKRLVSFNRDIYRDRNIVERLIGSLKENRRIFFCFENTAKKFAGMIKQRFVRQYLRLAA